MSTITSPSFTLVNLYSSQAARPAAAAERSAPAAPAAPTEAKHCGSERPARGPNRLVEAMMSALRELGFGTSASAAPASSDAASSSAAPAAPASGAAAAAQSTTQSTAGTAATPTADAALPADGSVAATPAQPAAQPSVSLEQAVHQFAHELFSALRQIGRGESTEQGGANRVDGSGGRRHHHGWRREGRDGYGDMAQRLDALAQTYAAPAAVAGASDAASASAASRTSISITLTVQDGQADGAAAAASPTAEAGATAAESAMATQAAPAAADAPAARRNPLLDAFSQLFGALKPQGGVAAPTDMADKLRTFLQTLAQAMRPEAMSSAPAPQVGGLVDVTA